MTEQNSGNTAAPISGLVKRQLDYVAAHLKEFASLFESGLFDKVSLKKLPLVEKTQNCLKALHLHPSDLKAAVFNLQEFLSNLLTLHLACLSAMAKSGKTFAKIPLFLRRVHEIIQCLGSNFKTSKKLLKFTTTLSCSIDDLPLKPTHSGTANPSFFVASDDKEKVMVFKPSKGELVCFKYSTIPQRTAYLRQIASYLIDCASGGRIGVPLSVQGHHDEQGSGSLQIFEENEGAVRSLSAKERMKISPRALHYQTVHRLRLYDLDGHLGNLLFKRDTQGEISLLPIDFDYTFPDIKDISGAESVQLKLGWRPWPQMDLPFDQEVKEYVLNLDVDQEAQILEKLEFSTESRCFFKAAAWALQSAVQSNLTPSEIADYLHSKNFKALFLQILGPAETEEAFSEAMKEGLDQQIAALAVYHQEKKVQFIEFCTLIQGYSTVENIPEKLAYELQNLVFDKENRYAFKLVQEMIKGHLPPKFIEKQIDYLKSFMNSDPVNFEIEFYFLADTFESAGQIAEAKTLRDFLSSR